MENTKVGPTSGGQYLKQLRERAGLSKTQVAEWAGVRNYTRYESEERDRPTRETVEQILQVLATRFSERKEALQRFGYVVNTPAPTDEEISWACSICQPIMDALPFPCYMLDIRGYVLGWNSILPYMLGIPHRTMDFILRPQRMTLYQAFFDSRLKIADMMENRRAFLSHIIRVMRQDWEAEYVTEEPWCQELLAESFRRYPEFREYWAMAVNPPISEIPARPLTNLRVNTRRGVVEVRIAIEKMSRDNRFKIVYLMPADARTLELCEAWKKEAAQAA